MKNLLTPAIVASCLFACLSVAQARSAYDGSWGLLFVTQRGACDPTYNFSVNITDGVVTHPNLVKFTGQVARSGAVHASVIVPDTMPPAQAGSRAIPVAGHGAAIREARAAQGTGPPNRIDEFLADCLLAEPDRPGARGRASQNQSSRS